MEIDRRIRLWGLVVAHAGDAPASVPDVCAVAVTVSGVDAAAITVMLAATPRETLYTSSPLAADLEDITLTLGEGPGMEASAGGGPALAADLAGADCLARWPAFAPAAVRAGIRAVFALPLRVGGIHLGVLVLCRAGAGVLSPQQLTDVLILADTTCALLLDTASGSTWAGGRGPEPVGLQHPEVHQATGMLTVQLGVDAATALVRLRAYAYAHDRQLSQVAGDVVARRLHFAPDHSTGGDT
ncbi:GAF domain-containing protein [Virgisporangium ochraceum]|uniref:GAF domain-containing protein n=1 Tax=Virgisporangium ochraceum TaxID=65505 RepID=A0A8J4EHM1_9ACTN|nr:ANTAR domain-containing protein [Virgisporangium ochraceum]GIJ75129.1 GAF domain-containing protein [Virgisporangium ochraceum]